MTSSAYSEPNLELARKINDQARSDPKAPIAGKFVGIANGQIVAAADDLDALLELLRNVQADPSQTLCIEVGLDYDQVQEIWGAR